MMRASTISLLLLAVVFSCSPQKDRSAEEDASVEYKLSQAQADEVLVEIGDRKITVGEFVDRLAAQSPYIRARFESPERRKTFVDDLVRFELLAAEARRLGYDKRPEVVEAKRSALVRRFIEQEIDDKLPLSSISEEEVKAYYEAHLEEFRQPEQEHTSSLEEVSRSIRNRLLREKRETAKRALIAKLKSEAKIEIDQDALKTIEAEPQASK